MGQLIGYARTSTQDQVAGLEAQIRDLTAAGCVKIFREQVSSIGDREQLDRALDYVRGGDTLVVTKLDRLARSNLGLWDIVNALEAVDDGGACLRILSFGGETLDTRSATGKLILTMFAGFAQFERESMLERQREGTAKAKAEDIVARAEGRLADVKYKGRKPTAAAKAGQAREMVDSGASVTATAKALGIGRASVYRAIEAKE